tara:strand:+ start:4030 stop:5166 length:1137 start_codon:yes stop_codon:yes gene_type:complete
MNKTTSPISILEFGSTYRRLAIYDETMLNNSLFFEEKIDFTRNENFIEGQIIYDLITKAEKGLGEHLNEILLMIDSSSIHSLDFSIKKNYEKKMITNNDINYLINECEKEVKFNNKEKDILHIIKYNLFLDEVIIEDLENVSQEASKVVIELKFILINKKVCDLLKNLFLKKQISIGNIFCISYIKSLGLIKKLGISGYNSFIDIGLKKSSLTIFNDNKLFYINNTHIGGDHITRDISKILKIDYRTAEAKKLKFYKNNLLENVLNEDELLKKIINSRLEEIIEILFLNCPFIKNNIINSDLKLFFIGNGSKVLNENLLSFGPEFNFIKQMSIIDEKNYDCCNSAMEFNSKNKKIQPKKTPVSIENKGFFEKLFGYFN